MKIKYIIPRSYPAIAGGEFYIIKLAEGAISSGNTAEILCSTAIDFAGLKGYNKGRHIDESNPYYDKYRNIPHYRIKPLELGDPFSKKIIRKIKLILTKKGIFLGDRVIEKFFYNGPLFPELSILDEEIDCVHSAYLPYTPILYGLIAGSKYKDIKRICTPFAHFFNPRYTDKDYYEPLKYYDLIIACTEYEKRKYREFGISPDKIKVLPMGVDYNLYSGPVRTRRGTKISFRKLYNIDNYMVLFCGLKTYDKGAVTLVEAASIINGMKKREDITFVMIGPTTRPFNRALRVARKKGAKIINITPSEMGDYYDKRKISAFIECDLYVMPSRSDAYGIAYLEAWAAGKPVIGARNPVMEEVIRENIDGLLVEFGDARGLAEKILYLIDNPGIRQKMGNAGRIRVKKKHEWYKITKATIHLYRSLGV